MAPGSSLTPLFPLTFCTSTAISSGLPGKPEPSLHFGRSNLLISPSSLPPCVNYPVQLLVLEGGDTAVSGRYFHNYLGAPCHLWSSAFLVSHGGLLTPDQPRLDLLLSVAAHRQRHKDTCDYSCRTAVWLQCILNLAFTGKALSLILSVVSGSSAC